MKKNLPIIIGISLPIIVVIVILIFASLPNMSIKPEHDFIFSAKEDRYNTLYENSYEIDGSKIVLSSNNLDTDTGNFSNKKIVEAPTLYMYSPVDEYLKEITLEEAERFLLDNGPMSPDGYSVDFSYRSNYNLANEIFGGSNRNYGAFIVKGDRAKGYYLPGLSAYSYEKQFIGWIIN